MGAYTTTIKNVFAKLYGTLRRTYAHYVKNNAGSQYFIFANVVLKRVERIPFYNDLNQAYYKKNPAGYLPSNLSPYYFKERPCVFHRSDEIVVQRWVTEKKIDTPVFVFTIFINGRYQDVYVNYDAAAMDIALFVRNAQTVAENESKIQSLQELFMSNLKAIEKAYNQCVLLLANKRYTDKNGFIATQKKYYENELQRYQISTIYIVKVCKECQGNALIAGAIPNIQLPLIVLTGGLSLAWITAANFNSEYAAAKTTQGVLKANMQEDFAEIENRVKTVGIIPGEPGDPRYQMLAEVEVKGKKGKKNYWWMVLVALGVGYSLTGKSNKNGKQQ